MVRKMFSLECYSLQCLVPRMTEVTKDSLIYPDSNAQRLKISVPLDLNIFLRRKNQVKTANNFRSPTHLSCLCNAQ